MLGFCAGDGNFSSNDIVDAELRRIIEDDRLLCHPAVIGELALSSLRDRGSVIAFLAAQRIEAFVATHDEVMLIIDRHAIFSMGIGYTDAHLLASILLDQRAALWTRDKRLRAAAEKKGLFYLPLPMRGTNPESKRYPCLCWSEG